MPHPRASSVPYTPSNSFNHLQSRIGGNGGDKVAAATPTSTPDAPNGTGRAQRDAPTPTPDAPRVRWDGWDVSREGDRVESLPEPQRGERLNPNPT